MKTQLQTQPALELTTELRTRLQQEFQLYAIQAAELKSATEALEATKRTIQHLREAAGLSRVEVDGFSSLSVSQDRASIERMKTLLVQKGVSADVVMAAIEESKRATEPSERITLPAWLRPTKDEPKD